MAAKQSKEKITLEVMLLVVIVGMTYLMYRLGGYKMVALNLFFLPIVLSGYYLGRTSAGITALFSTLAVTIACSVEPTGFSGFHSPIMMGLAITVWAGVLGLTAILVGTLCDERAAKVDELHEAYVGVVEVLSRYLQSGQPKVKTRSMRIAEMCEAVAAAMGLSRKETDDIRVGAMLFDLGSVQITTKVISRAVDTLEAQPNRDDNHTFLGMDLVHSLSSVLHGAVPLLLSQDDAARELAEESAGTSAEVPLGARIIRAVRSFDALAYGPNGAPKSSPQQALRELRKNTAGDADDEVLNAIERAIRRTAAASPAPAGA